MTCRFMQEEGYLGLAEQVVAEVDRNIERAV